MRACQGTGLESNVKEGNVDNDANQCGFKEDSEIHLPVDQALLTDTQGPGLGRNTATRLHDNDRR